MKSQDVDTNKINIILSEKIAPHMNYEHFRKGRLILIHYDPKETLNKIQHYLIYLSLIRQRKLRKPANILVSMWCGYHVVCM